jgi:uncharacterized protein
LPTVTDIISELEKPGRDPRPEFKTATFAAGIEKVADLKPGMTLEGVVTNVAAFGAFVDVGVHQDGLVHVSAMSHNFVKDPREVVKSGDVVRVKVMEVDIPRQRIGLSLRLDDEPGASGGKDAPRGQQGDRSRGTSSSKGNGRQSNGGQGNRPQRDRRGGGPAATPAAGSMADALRKAGFGK